MKFQMQVRVNKDGNNPFFNGTVPFRCEAESRKEARKKACNFWKVEDNAISKLKEANYDT